MKISVIIPVYNVAPYLEACVNSVLNQTFQDFEIIAVNDGSTDESSAILEKFKHRIKIFSQTNKGLAKTLNLGITQAQGEYIAFIDGDDLWVEDKLEIQIQQIENNSEIDAIFGRMKQFLSEEISQNTERFKFEEYPSSPFAKITILVKKTAFTRFGMFADVKFGDFIEWFDRVKSLGLKYNVTNEIVAFRRIRGNSMSQQHGYYPALLGILKKKIDEKRKLIQ